MKSFKTFRLDTTNHLLWREGGRVPIPPKNFDVLAYLVEHAGRVVTQEEILEALWPETFVNPEVLRKYILEIRKTLGDRPNNPEFIETLPKRGYRFIAPITDESLAEPQDLLTVSQIGELAIREKVGYEPDRPRIKGLLIKGRFWRLAAIPLLVIVVGAAIGASFRLTRGRANPPALDNNSIAVLPFADISPAKDQEYFSDGLSEQLIHDLAKVSGLRVVGRSSAFQFKGKNEDIREVGRKLGVANVLEGSVRREGNRVRITAELTKAEDRFQLWSQTYDRKMNDIFAVQDEIARATTEALQLKLLRSNGKRVASNLRSANTEAYQAYLEANYFSGRGQSKEDLDKALAYANTAIKLDEKYAPAWALRASVQNMMAQYGFADISEGFRRARDDADQAIALDPTSASAYLALARTQISHDWDWDAANTFLTKAAALEPGNVDVFRIGSRLAWVSGDLDQAVKLAEQVVALEPLRSNSYLGLGHLLYLAGRYYEAQSKLQKALELNPQAAFVHFTLSKIFLADRKPQQALVEIEKEPNEWAKLTGQALVYHALGREHDSDTSMAELIAKYETGAAYQIAQVYAFRRESDRSFAWLERAHAQRDSGLTDMKTDPQLKNLCHDRRYADLLQKMRLST